MSLTMTCRLYHGSSVHELSYLEPRHRYTPGAETESPEGIYASDDPAFAAGHAFAWHSAKGIALGYFSDDAAAPVTLQLPVNLRHRLDQSVSIYTLETDSFTLLSDVAPSG